jgi:allophanate hydrolase
VADGEGHAIEAEIWEIPTDRFGEFVVQIQAPLGIGTVQMQRTGPVKGFLCEASGTIEAEDISHYGGWRAYAAERFRSTIK